MSLKNQHWVTQKQNCSVHFSLFSLLFLTVLTVVKIQQITRYMCIDRCSVFYSLLSLYPNPQQQILLGD